MTRFAFSILTHAAVWAVIVYMGIGFVEANFNWFHTSTVADRYQSALAVGLLTILSVAVDEVGQ